MEYVLVFQGIQGHGKTSWFKSLVPHHLRKDNLLFNPNNKDSVKQAISTWICELGELDATFRKSYIGDIKSFLSLDQDEIRLPYSAAPGRYPRRTVFFASVNDQRFLVDETGNRRFWVIAVQGLDHEHKVDMQQLFAEVMQWAEAGEQHWLTDEEEQMQLDREAQHRVLNPIEELILDYFDFQADYEMWGREGSLLSTTQVLKAIDLKTTHSTTSSAGRVLTRLFNEHKMKFRKTSHRTFYPMPPRIIKRIC